MSFGLPSIKVRPINAGVKPNDAANIDFRGNTFETPDVMKWGLQSGKSSKEVPHPLFTSHVNYRENRQNMNMAILRNTQGMHAPLRIAMEQKSVKKIGRLPFLPSSNIMRDALTGQDLEIGPEDVFNTPEFTEHSGQPHAVVEKSLGIL